ncbi:MAG TPA: hypothetical protein VFS20_33710 [Longimicrobium sp.]|nr:hypothetical protein [Longimicrobium sp.]
MKKLTLNLDALEVESFDTNHPRGRQGTVLAHDDEDSDTTAPCWAGTYEGPNCDSTGFQILCTCTAGGENNGTCDAVCNTQWNCTPRTYCG